MSVSGLFTACLSLHFLLSVSESVPRYKQVLNLIGYMFMFISSLRLLSLKSSKIAVVTTSKLSSLHNIRSMSNKQ